MKNRFVAASFEGPAIFVDRDIFYVNVSDVRHNDLGVSASITDVGLPGTQRLRTSEIAASWNAFRFNDGDWHALHIPWRVFFDFEVIRSCLELAKQNATGVIAWQDGAKIFAEYDHRLVALLLRKYKIG
jgi:hypothetical protein